jgi:general secretion pathway protein K
VKARRPEPHRQRGVAVITALLLTTLAITIVASLFWQQQVQVRSIENQRLQLQKQWVLRGALDWAALILREDAKHSSADTLDEPWAVPLADTRLDQYVENDRGSDDVSDATLSGGISDAQARYNLTNLSSNGIINHSEVAAFARLLGNVKLNPALALATAEAMSATQVSGNTSPSTAQPLGLFVHMDDLLAVPGFTAPMLGYLKDFVIFLPRTTPINVNTAPAEVLAARIEGMSISEASSLVAGRDTANFRNLADFTNRLQGKSYSAPANEVSVTTNYFLVDGNVRMSRAGLKIQSLIERNAANTRLVWIREH